jgi:hypothetical protein
MKAIGSSIGTFEDSTLVIGKTYYYALTLNDGTESGKSAAAVYECHPKATIINFSQVSSNQGILEVSYPVLQDGAYNISLRLNGVLRSVRGILSSSKKILLTFPEKIFSGNHTIQLLYLKDAAGLLADNSQVYQFVSTYSDESLFFARSIELMSNSSLKITFNEAVQPVSIFNPLHFTVKNTARSFPVQSIQFDSTQPTIAFLTLNANDRLNEFAGRIELRIESTLLSRDGKKINNGKGQVVSLLLQTNNLDNIIVYPNPARVSVKSSAPFLTFINMPNNVRISIFTSVGKKVTDLTELSGFEGIHWNGRDQQDQIISSGIYIFRAEQLDANGDVINTKLGKFAVIR